MLAPIDWSRFHKDLPVTCAITVITTTLWGAFNLGLLVPFVSLGGVMDLNAWLAHVSHVSILHLASNLLIVIFMGMALERYVGWWRYLLMVLLVWNLSVLGLYFFNPGAVLGFSGIGMGLMVLAYFYWQNVAQMAQMIGILLLLNLAFGLMPGVSWQGHAIGGLSGLVVYALIRFAQGGQAR
jgi:membrane associated rhomboid family serine protease